ncbi:MAG: hypothetical protein QMD92_00010 [bacterium]|nr:hypothetical protein [bacterium]
MLRMLKFYPDQIVRNWEKIGYAIEQALPPIVDSHKAEGRMNRILESILAGKIEVHVFVVYTDERPTVYGIVSTAITNAVDSDNKELLIYSLYASHSLNRELIFEGLELIKKYARSQECAAISGYTNIAGLKRLIENAGGSSSFTYLRLEV